MTSSIVAAYKAYFEIVALKRFAATLKYAEKAQKNRNSWWILVDTEKLSVPSISKGMGTSTILVGKSGFSALSIHFECHSRTILKSGLVGKYEQTL